MENVEAVDTPEVEVVLTGLAAKINAEVVALTDACCKAISLEGGLDTAAGIRKTSVELRDSLIAISRTCHGLYQDTLVTRDELLGGVSVVQAASKKKALEAKIAEDQAKLAAM